MSFEFEREEENNKKENIKKDRKFIIFSAFILISIIIGIITIFSREKNNNISAMKIVKRNNISKSIPQVSSREGIAVIDLTGFI